MSSLGGLVFILSSFLFLFLLFALIKILHRLWWKPTRIQKLMALQGIKGPSYRFIHGNSKEISSMQKEAMSRPKSLSHDIFSYVQPHFYLWNRAYGNQLILIYLIFISWFLNLKTQSLILQGKIFFNGMALELSWSLQNLSCAKRY